MPTVRCYPKHTPDVGQPDHSNLADFSVNLYEDAHMSDDFAEFMSTWPIVAAASPTTAADIPTGGYAWWNGMGHYDNHAFRADIQWDFTPLPVAAVVLSSVLHTRIKSAWCGWVAGEYWPYGSMFGAITIPGAADGNDATSDFDAGSSWVGGSEPWIAWDSVVIANGALILAPGIQRNVSQTIWLGWGHFSLGECSYIDVTYTYPPTITSVVPNSGARGTA